MRHSMRLTGLALVVAGMLALAGCVGSAESAPTPSGASSGESPEDAPSLGELGALECQPPSPSLGAEVQGTASDGVTAYGLTFGPDADAIVASDESMKMVVRMTGSGPLAVQVIAPDGSERPLDWGPELHGGSNFERPGEEWGIGFTFDEAGCWQVAFERGEADRADFWFDVTG